MEGDQRRVDAGRSVPDRHRRRPTVGRAEVGDQATEGYSTLLIEYEIVATQVLGNGVSPEDIKVTDVDRRQRGDRFGNSRRSGQSRTPPGGANSQEE